MKKRIAALLGICATIAAAQAQVATDADTRTDQLVRNGLSVNNYSLQALNLPGQPGWRGDFVVVVDLGGRLYELFLSPTSVRAPNFKAMYQDHTGAYIPVEPPPEQTYRGFVAGVDASHVAASLVDGQLEALIHLEGAEHPTWAVQPLTDVDPKAPRDVHIVHNVVDSFSRGETCGVDNPFNVPVPHQRNGHVGDDGILICEIAADADVEFYQLNGSNVNNTISDITNIINRCTVIYERDCQVKFAITTIIVRTTEPDPYSSTNPNTLLVQFQNHWNSQQGSIQRDTAHLFTGKNLDGSVIGIAYLAVICNRSQAYGLSQSRYTANLANRTALTSHEVGHNFAANHCNQSGGTCNPCNIMCSALGGCTGNVTSFGCSSSVIANYAKSRTCLEDEGDNIILPLPFVDTFPTTTLDTGKWRDNQGATINANALNEPSAPYSLDTNQSDVVETHNVDTTGQARVFVSFYLQARNVQNLRNVFVQYHKPGDGSFGELINIIHDGVDQDRFRFYELVMPNDGIGQRSRVRIRGNTGTDDGHFYIDDVRIDIYCRADLTRDRRLDIRDFFAFQSLYAQQDFLGDWNNDGRYDIRDFFAYQASFAAGCY